MSQTHSVQDFKVLPIRFSSNTTVDRELFIKEHSVRHHEKNKPPGKTLFILNIPPYVTTNSLKHAFSDAGIVDNVILEQNPTYSNCGFQTGFVVFQSRNALLKSLKLTSLKPFSTPEAHISTGLSKWIYEYNSSICNHDELEKNVNDFMAKLDSEEAKQNDKNPIDEDGWTVVTKKSRNPGISRKESVSNKLIEKSKAKSRKKQLKNFYTFQLKEEKMKHIVALRKSFQESKEKVNAMKKLRTFKPY